MESQILCTEARHNRGPVMATKFVDENGKQITAAQHIAGMDPDKVPARWKEQAEAESGGSVAEPVDTEDSEGGAE